MISMGQLARVFWVVGLLVTPIFAATETGKALNGLSNTVVENFLLITLLGILPTVLLTATCFPFIIIVLSITRQALGFQIPPNMLLTGLALFITFNVMEPYGKEAYSKGIEPYLNQKIGLEAAINNTIDPFFEFIKQRTDPDKLAMFEPSTSKEGEEVYGFKDYLPAFIVSEITRGFQVGFLIFLPFLVIDIIIASILMAMGMVMVPPSIVSLPIKIAFFTLSDGWSLIVKALIQNYQ